jgi:hypothetical protein
MMILSRHTQDFIARTIIRCTNDSVGANNHSPLQTLNGNEFAIDWDGCRKNNFIRIRILEKMRDSLLPKLMSGEVSVIV